MIIFGVGIFLKHFCTAGMANTKNGFYKLDN